MIFDQNEWDLRSLQTDELRERCFSAWQTAQQLYQWRLQLLEEQRACVQKRMELLDQQETFLLDFISERNGFPGEKRIQTMYPSITF